jgi:hypothetical protein
MLQKAGLISGQCRQYANVAIELASNPEIAPERRNLVGARPRTAQRTAAVPGAESRRMLNGHERQECPRMAGRRVPEAVLAMTHIPLSQTSAMGVAVTVQPAPTCAPGRESLATASSEPAATKIGKANLAQNKGLRMAADKLVRSPKTVSIRIKEPMLAMIVATASRRTAGASLAGVFPVESRLINSSVFIQDFERALPRLSNLDGC